MQSRMVLYLTAIALLVWTLLWFVWITKTISNYFLEYVRNPFSIIFGFPNLAGHRLIRYRWYLFTAFMP